MNKLESAYQAISETVLNLNLSIDDNNAVTNMVIYQLMDQAAAVANQLERLIFNIEKDKQ